MRRGRRFRRLSFRAQFGIVVVLMGVALASAVLYIALAQDSADARQAARDRVSEESNVVLGVLHAEEATLVQFATQSGQAAATSPDVAGLVQELSAATSPRDMVGVVTAAGGEVAKAGRSVAATDVAWVVQAATTGSTVVADTVGHPWLVGSVPVPDHAGTFAFVARDMAHSQLAAVATGTTALGWSGFAIVRDGRFALSGRVAGVAVEPGAPVAGGLAGPAAADGPSLVVASPYGDVAGVSRTMGGGYRLLVTVGVSDTRSLADDIPVAGVTVALVLVALGLMYGLMRRELQRPLRRLDAALSGLARADYDVPVSAKTEDVLGTVGASFLAMRAELRSLLSAAQARAEIAFDLSSAASLDSALRAVCERLRAATDAQLAVVIIAGSDGRVAALHAAGLPQPRDPQALLAGDGVIATAARRQSTGVVLACPVSGVEMELGLGEVCAAPLRVGTNELGALAIAGGLAGPGFGRHALELVAVAAEQVALAVERERVLVMARMQASTDSLTGLYNRRFLTDFLEQQVAIADRASSTFSLVMIDLDHFKAVNDQLGHEVGDESLRAVAATLSGTLRRSDLAARLGGDEFLVVMSDTSLEAAGLVAEKLRSAIAAVRVASPTTRRRARISVSIGVASRAPGGAGVDRLLTIVDQALYRAKGEGRNRVVLAGTSGPPKSPRGPARRRPLDLTRARRARGGDRE